MTPSLILFTCLAAVAVTIALPFIFSRRTKPDPYSHIADAIRRRDAKDPYAEYFEDHVPALDKARQRFSDEPTPGAKYPRSSRQFGKRERVPTKGTVYLTRRQLEQINIKRKAAGRTPLNRTGFAAAISHPWDRPQAQPYTPTDWITYLILYECFVPDHMQHSISADSSITITPDAPFNGHGGDFGGAGASGNWADPATTAAQSAAMISQMPAYDASSYAAPDPAPVPSYTPDTPMRADPTPSYSAPDPTPSYRAPDTSSSYTPDTSAPSVDTSSSY